MSCPSFSLFSFFLLLVRALACCTASPLGRLLPAVLLLGPPNILPLLLPGHLQLLLPGRQLRLPQPLGRVQTGNLPPGRLQVQVVQVGPPLLHLRRGDGGALAHRASGRRVSGLFSSFNLSLLLHAQLDKSVWHEEANLKLTQLVSRLAKMPRRHQLRGPFGQMLMEEMAKSDLKQQVAS